MQGIQLLVPDTSFTHRESSITQIKSMADAVMIIMEKPFVSLCVFNQFG